MASLRDLAEHLERHEQENLTDRFMSAPPGTFAQIYNKQNLRKDLQTPGWCKLWVSRFPEKTGKIVGHASLYDNPNEVPSDGVRVVYGHLGIERPYRGWQLARELQRHRLAFCDEHGLTLVGAVALGNDHSFWGCRRAGFEYLRQDPETKAIWMYRSPQTR